MRIRLQVPHIRLQVPRIRLQVPRIRLLFKPARPKTVVRIRLLFKPARPKSRGTIIVLEVLLVPVQISVKKISVIDNKKNYKAIIYFL